MKALTVRQPWAGLIARGIKDIENRTWQPTGSLDIGDRFAIHAGQRRDLDYDPDTIRWSWLNHWACDAQGVIVCTVRLADVVRDAKSPWAADGYWHWVLEKPHLIRHMPHMRGHRGLWEPDL